MTADSEKLHPMPSYEHPHSFDPTYGYAMEELLKITPPELVPADFEAFWLATMEEASKNTRVLGRQGLEPPDPGWKLELLKIQGLGTTWFGAWLLQPSDATTVRRAFVVGHGYGGREGIDWPVMFQDAAYIFPAAQGFHISAQVGLPSTAAWHVVHGISSPTTYLIRHCVAGLQSAADVLTADFPELDGQLGFIGGSFGGGLGALMLPWSSSFSRAFLKVPTFGHHPLRLKCECVGSGEAVRLFVNRDPSIQNTLAYFDAAIAATFIRIPVLVSVALFDPAVPPPGQFAVANSLGGPKHLHVLNAAHFEHPSLLPEEEALSKLVHEWFSH